MVEEAQRDLRKMPKNFGAAMRFIAERYVGGALGFNLFNDRRAISTSS